MIKLNIFLLALLLSSITLGNDELDNEQLYWDKASKVASLSGGKHLFKIYERRVRDHLESIGDRYFEDLAYRDNYEMPDNVNEIIDRYSGLAKDIYREEFSYSKYQEYLVLIYMNNFTIDELDKLIVLYESDTGKLLTERLPLILSGSEEIIQTISERYSFRLGKLGEKLNDELGVPK